MKSYDLEVNGKSYRVEVESEPGHVFKVRVNGQELMVELKSVHFDRAASAGETPLVVRQLFSSGSELAGMLTIRCPIPGEIRKIAVQPGDTVREGDLVLVIEAMKMENNIVADSDGRVTEVLVAVGDTVKMNQALVTLEVIK